MGLSNTRGTFTSADKTFFEGENGRISVSDYFRGNPSACHAFIGNCI